MSAFQWILAKVTERAQRAASSAAESYRKFHISPTTTFILNLASVKLIADGEKLKESIALDYKAATLVRAAVENEKTTYALGTKNLRIDYDIHNRRISVLGIDGRRRIDVRFSADGQPPQFIFYTRDGGVETFGPSGVHLVPFEARSCDDTDRILRRIPAALGIEDGVELLKDHDIRDIFALELPSVINEIVDAREIGNASLRQPDAHLEASQMQQEMRHMHVSARHLFTEDPAVCLPNKVATYLAERRDPTQGETFIKVKAMFANTLLSQLADLSYTDIDSMLKTEYGKYQSNFFGNLHLLMNIVREIPQPAAPGDNAAERPPILTEKAAGALVFIAKEFPGILPNNGIRQALRLCDSADGKVDALAVEDALRRYPSPRDLQPTPPSTQAAEAFTPPYQDDAPEYGEQLTPEDLESLVESTLYDVGEVYEIRDQNDDLIGYTQIPPWQDPREQYDGEDLDGLMPEDREGFAPEAHHGAEAASNESHFDYSFDDQDDFSAEDEAQLSGQAQAGELPAPDEIPEPDTPAKPVGTYQAVFRDEPDATPGPTRTSHQRVQPDTPPVKLHP